MHVHPPPLIFSRRGWVFCGSVVTRSLSSHSQVHTAMSEHEAKQRGMHKGGGGQQIGVRTLVTHGGSHLGTAESSVARGCSLRCPYLLEEVRTRLETEAEEVRGAGRTYRTPRRLLVPCAALVEGRTPVLPPNSPGGGGLTTHPFRCVCVSTSMQPDTGASVSARWNWRLQSGRSLWAPGSMPPPIAMVAPEVLW